MEVIFLIKFLSFIFLLFNTRAIIRPKKKQPNVDTTAKIIVQPNTGKVCLKGPFKTSIKFLIPTRLTFPLNIGYNQ